MKIEIVGAGPAGLISGLRLIGDNDVTIYEMHNEIESSPCAECISVKSLEKLKRETGFSSEKYVSKSIEGLAIESPNGKKGFIHREGAVLDRSDWEQGMAEEFEERGGDLVTGRRIGSLSELDGDVIIGGDGPFSVVGEEIGGEVRNEKIFYAMDVPHDTSNFNYAKFYLDKDLSPYYLWMFPKEGAVNMGGMDREGVTELARREGVDLSEEDVDGWVDSIGGSRFQKGGVFLIGDSGSTRNPFSRGGLGPIVHASEALSASIRNGRPEDYEAKVRENLVTEEDFEAEKILKELDNMELRKIGDIIEGENILNPSLSGKIKSLLNPFLIRRIRKLEKAWGRAAKYW